MMTCETYMYSKVRTSGTSNQIVSRECHKNAPYPFGRDAIYQAFPLVRSDEFCGEYVEGKNLVPANKTNKQE